MLDSKDSEKTVPCWKAERSWTKVLKVLHAAKEKSQTLWTQTSGHLGAFLALVVPALSPFHSRLLSCRTIFGLFLSDS